MSQAFFLHGHVGHSRLGIKENGFRYPIFNYLFCCRDEESISSELRQRFHRVLGLRARDYLDGQAESFDRGIREFLKIHCKYEVEEVWLQTCPRMFGYVFNPVSFWFCKRNGELEAVLVEVNNTFGERHFYWLYKPGEMIHPFQWLRAEKVFHVSPFYPVDGYYEFRFQFTGEKSRVDIVYFSEAGKIRLITWIKGNLKPQAKQTLFSLLWRYGWMTPLVVLRIHWQALKLWCKRVSFFSKPEPPTKEIT
ncbi:MAG: DUF1365 domain-containing protein [Bdellovibrionales bacterium]|nr:DUF1365 domain-containing protein [Bdellovibrionales bacterium]